VRQNRRVAVRTPPTPDGRAHAWRCRQIRHGQARAKRERPYLELKLFVAGAHGNYLTNFVGELRLTLTPCAYALEVLGPAGDAPSNPASPATSAAAPR